MISRSFLKKPGHHAIVARSLLQAVANGVSLTCWPSGCHAYRREWCGARRCPASGIGATGISRDHDTGSVAVVRGTSSRLSSDVRIASCAAHSSASMWHGRFRGVVIPAIPKALLRAPGRTRPVDYRPRCTPVALEMFWSIHSPDGASPDAAEFRTVDGYKERCLSTTRIWNCWSRWNLWARAVSVAVWELWRLRRGASGR